MIINKLERLTEDQIKDLQSLMCELTSNVTVSTDMLRRTVASANTHLFALIEENGHIVGCASLCVFESPTGLKASVEDVVVSSLYRGQKFGRKLMEHIIDYAKKELAPIDLHLTSNPQRVSANALYKAVGFEKRETNAYEMIIK